MYHSSMTTDNEPDDSVTQKPVRQGYSTELKIALFGIGATLIASLMGGFFTLASIDRQSESSSQQSADDFRREERRTAYAAFYTSAISLEDRERELDLTVFDGSLLEMPQNTAYSLSLEALQEARDDFFTKQAEVELVGSLWIRKALEELTFAHSNVTADYFGITAEFYKLDADQAIIEERVNEFQESMKEATEFRYAYLNAAREDLGVDE